MRARFALAFLLAGLATELTALGCAGSGLSKSEVVRGPVPKGNVVHGRLLFMNGTEGRRGCVFCHALQAAGANGPFGPDLDNIYRQGWKLRGLSEARIRRVVVNQILRTAFCLDPSDYGRCMPKGLVAGDDAVDVASFVARCAGRSGKRGCRPDDGGRAPGHRGREGWHFYTQLRCAGCHSTSGNAPGSTSRGLAGAVGPTFKGLSDSKVKLANGTTVAVDEAYLLESIISPDTQIVQGFAPGVMTARIPPGSVTLAQAKALIAYINTVK